MDDAWRENFLSPTGAFYRGPAAPGRWYGNRGKLHGGDRRRVRDWRDRRWLACVTTGLGPPDTFMTPGHHTEVFFHDEATALAAGHRPCYRCRQSDAERFNTLFRQANGVDAGFDLMDERLHGDRLDPSGGQRTWVDDSGSLPDGTFVRVDDEPWVVVGAQVHRWSPQGYDATAPLPDGQLEVLTPAVTVATLRAGYRPAVLLG